MSLVSQCAILKHVMLEVMDCDRNSGIRLPDSPHCHCAFLLRTIFACVSWRNLTKNVTSLEFSRHGVARTVINKPVLITYKKYLIACVVA